MEFKGRLKKPKYLNAKSQSDAFRLPSNFTKLLECGICYMQQNINSIYITSCCSKVICKSCFDGIIGRRCPFCKAAQYHILRNRILEEMLNICTNSAFIITSDLLEEIPEDTIIMKNCVTRKLLFTISEFCAFRRQMHHFGLFNYYGFRVVGRKGKDFIVERIFENQYQYQYIAEQFEFVKLSKFEKIHIGLSVCDIISYLHSKDAEIGKISADCLCVSRDLTKIKLAITVINHSVAPIISEEEEVNDLKSIMLFMHYEQNFDDVKTVEEFKQRLFDMIDADNLQRGIDWNGHNAFGIKHDIIYQNFYYLCEYETMEEKIISREGVYESIKYICCNNCAGCEKRKHIFVYVFYIRGLGYYKFCKYGKIIELRKCISNYLTFDISAIILLNQNDKVISDSIALFDYFEYTEEIKLKVDYRLA